MPTRYPAHSQLYLGRGRMLYCGPLQHLETHVYGADVLHVGIYRPFRIMLADGEWRSCRSAVVPAGTPHALDLNGGVHGKLFVERDGPDWSGFRTRFPHVGTTALSFDDAEAIDCFRWIYEEDPTPTTLARRLQSLLKSDEHRPPARLDARIRRVIDLICREPSRNFSQDELAGVIGLSGSRFLHLFREHAGMPYRRLRRWKRVMAAAEFLHAGDNMTRAAVDAGFADATHFSHTFRHIFGVNPAPVFRNIQRFEVNC